MYSPCTTCLSISGLSGRRGSCIPNMLPAADNLVANGKKLAAHGLYNHHGCTEDAVCSCFRPDTQHNMLAVTMIHKNSIIAGACTWPYCCLGQTIITVEQVRQLREVV